MDEDTNIPEEKPSAAKLSRKLGEKLRRDRLNSLITQLAEEIPIIRYAHKRLDKTAILRLTVSYMELHYGLKRKQLSNNGGVSGSCLLDWLKKMTDDALMIMNQSGTILYISPKITDHIGFYQTDMLGHNIDQFIHRNDLHPLISLFTSDDTNKPGENYATFKPNPTRNGFPKLENWHDENSLYIRLLKATRRKSTSADAREYETFTIHCTCEKTSKKASHSGRAWMVCVMKPVCKEPLREVQVQISEFIKNNEWASMHCLDGQILAQDHRCALFLGRMPSEDIGRTPYGMVKQEDLGMIALSHRNIMTDHETCTVFRMETAMNETLYIQAQSIIVKESWTKTPKCIVSVNTILDLEKGMRLLDLQREATSKILQDSPDLFEEHQVAKVTDGNEKSVSELNKTSDSEYHDSRFSIESDSIKDVTEFYEEEAKSYPKLYSSDDSCSQTSSRLAEGEKRSFECVDSEISGSESNASGLSDSPLNEQCGDRNGSSSQQRTPVLKSLLNSKKRLLTCEISANNDKSKGDSMPLPKSDSLPLLKGLLDGSVTMDESSFGKISRKRKPSDNCRSFESYTDPSDDVICRDKVSLKREKEYHSQASEDSESLCLGSEASSLGIQLPTISSTNCTAASTEASTEHKTGEVVYNKFTKQLELKHTMLKKTISSQRSTLEILRNQIQRSHNNVQLGTEEKNIHDTLLEKLAEAETQVELQGQLLGELVTEIETQKHSTVDLSIKS